MRISKKNYSFDIFLSTKGSISVESRESREQGPVLMDTWLVGGKLMEELAVEAIGQMEGNVGPRHFGHIAGVQDEEEARLRVDVQHQREQEAVVLALWIGPRHEDRLTGVAAFLSPAYSLPCVRIDLLLFLEPHAKPLRMMRENCMLTLEKKTLFFFFLPYE